MFDDIALEASMNMGLATSSSMVPTISIMEEGLFDHGFIAETQGEFGALESPTGDIDADLDYIKSQIESSMHSPNVMNSASLLGTGLGVHQAAPASRRGSIVPPMIPTISEIRETGEEQASFMNESRESDSDANIDKTDP
eukprot:jgi/Hompol1/4120/HPOL_003473-RA